MTTPRAAVIGAGPMGLALARSFLHHGIPVDVYERHSDVGGIWDPDNPGSPMYESAHFNSSKTQSGFRDHPMPEDYPDYPSWRQVLDYLRGFADAHDLYRVIRLSTSVERVVPRDDGGWEVHVDGAVTPYRWLVCATGTTWFPNRPAIPGIFAGEVIHSSEYRHAERFRGKRVLVVGAGASGADIACDAARTADAALWSVRRGYHIIPKQVFGMPVDVFAHTGPKLPTWLAQRLFGALLRLIVGDLTRYGLPAPDHRLFETHPLASDLLLHHLGHGDIRAKGDVARFDGGEVVFADGSREAVDVVVLATGYRWHLPYLPDDLLSWSDHRPDLVINLFSREHPTLFVAGLLETNAGVYGLFDEMADLVAHAILADRDDAEAFARFRAWVGRDHDVSGGVRYVDSARHRHYANIDAYHRVVRRLRRHMRWAEPTAGALAAAPRLAARAAS